VERAVAAATTEQTAAPAQKPAKTKKSGERRPPRSPEEIARLGERFYAAVCDTPGETMTVLAARLGVSSRSLERPVAHLKKARRVRSAGERRFTRYFPMVADKPETETEAEPALAAVRS
jgi:hypothetical protein